MTTRIERAFPIYTARADDPHMTTVFQRTLFDRVMGRPGTYVVVDDRTVPTGPLPNIYWAVFGLSFIFPPLYMVALIMAAVALMRRYDHRRVYAAVVFGLAIITFILGALCTVLMVFINRATGPR